MKIQKEGNETLSLHTLTTNIKSYTSRQGQKKISSFGDFIRTATYTCHVLVQLANSHFSVSRKEKTGIEAAMTKCGCTTYEATKNKRTNQHSDGVPQV